METEDRELLSQARKGDPAATGRLIARHQGWVRTLMARVAPMGVDADDLAQDVFIAVLRRLGTFDPAEGEFKAWVFGIARHVSHQAWDSTRARRAHWQPLVEGAFEDAANRASPAGPAESERALSTLRGCIRALAPRAKALVELRYRDQMPFAGIAQAVGGGASSVRGTLTRIRSLLRDCLKRNGVTMTGVVGE